MASFISDLVGEVSSLLSLMRLSYDFSTVVSDYRSISYGGDCCVSGDMDYLSESYVYGDTAHFRICEIVMVIFLMVPQSGA